MPSAKMPSASERREAFGRGVRPRYRSADEAFKQFGKWLSDLQSGVFKRTELQIRRRMLEATKAAMTAEYNKEPSGSSTMSRLVWRLGKRHGGPKDGYKPNPPREPPGGSYVPMGRQIAAAVRMDSSHPKIGRVGFDTSVRTIQETHNERDGFPVYVIAEQWEKGFHTTVPFTMRMLAYLKTIAAGKKGYGAKRKWKTYLPDRILGFVAINIRQRDVLTRVRKHHDTYMRRYQLEMNKARKRAAQRRGGT